MTERPVWTKVWTSKFWKIERAPSLPLYALIRSDTPQVSLTESEEVFKQVVKQCAKIDRSQFFLMLDLRISPMRNDPEYEKMSTPYRHEILSKWRNTFILVATEHGQKQLNRHKRQDDTGHLIFQQEAAIYRFLEHHQ